MALVWMMIFIVFWHWVADFVGQPEWMKRDKSSSIGALTGHVGIYSAFWLFPSCLWACMYGTQMLWFAPITFVCHWITDYFTSRLNKRLWDNDKVNAFFISIGFDQFLHYTQLFLTFMLLLCGA